MSDKISEVLQNQRHQAVFPIVGVDHCSWLLKYDFAEVVHDGEKIARVLEYGYRLYDYDMVLVFLDPYVEAEAMGCELEFKPYPRIKAQSKGSGCTNRTKEIIKAARILKHNVQVPVFVSIKGPFSLASFLAGTEDFLKILLTGEREVLKYLEKALEFQISYLNRLLKLDVHIFIGDPMASASVISPNLFRKFAFEPLGLLIKNINRAGLIAGLHICGETLPLIPILDELKADILSIEDIKPKAKTLKMGGVSTTTILSGSVEKIKNEVKDALKEDRLILATSCDVPAETNPDNLKTMIKTARGLSV